MPEKSEDRKFNTQSSFESHRLQSDNCELLSNKLSQEINDLKLKLNSFQLEPKIDEKTEAKDSDVFKEAMHNLKKSYEEKLTETQEAHHLETNELKSKLNQEISISQFQAQETNGLKLQITALQDTI